MARTLSLAPLTVLELPPAEMVACAAEAGYRWLGLRLAPVLPNVPLPYPIVGQRELLRELMKRMDDSDIRILDIEFIRLAPETRIKEFVPMLETGARLGAQHVLAGGADPEERRLMENFGRLCEAAAEVGLVANLEPIPMFDLGTLAQAARILSAVDQPNSGIVVDPIHFDRAGEKFETLATIPKQWLRYMQFCDAPAERPDKEGMQFQARFERKIPGEGGIDLLGLLRAMPQDIPIAIEVPMTEMAKSVGAVERARRLLGATRELLAKLESEPAR